ncbi:MAG: hypothetical protein E7021_01580 [Alphaproteobacteria bacterium]|nr:hypothetical protein [Alphaproteobacteria bacterium]
MNKTNKNDKRSQKGRSMVEMLGVLAIVGVLSVGGISAYSKAVEKHKANEALHKASMMATTVSAYAMTNDGKLPSTITDFANSGYATTLTDNGTQFNLTLSGIDKDVCTQMKNSKGGMVRDVVCDESGNATITYYKNLATTEAEGEKSPTGGKFDPACKNVTCDDGLKCFHGECKCPNGVFMCGTECCAEGTYCAKGTNTSTYICAKPTSGCTQNGDCKDAEGNVDTTKYCKFSDGSCTNPGTGTCTDKGELDDTNDFTVKTLNLPGGALTVYKSSGTMNWWSASNLCQAHGKQLVTMSDLGLADSGTNTHCYFNSSHSNYATKPCICNGGSDSDCSATNVAIRSTDVFGESGSLWLADNSKSGSCGTRFVSHNSGAVLDDSRYSGYLNNSAICRDP